MIIFSLILFAFILMNFGIWFCVSKFYLKDDFVLIIGDNMKRFIQTTLVAILIATLLCSVKLYKMGSCQTKGWITNASTQYSWVMDQCQAKNSTGVYVDIERSRGMPGEDHSDVTP